MSAAFSVVKRLLSSNKVSYIITAVVMLCATTSGDSKLALSNGNYTWLLAVLTPFFFVFYDYLKLMHLGATKQAYFFGSITSYALTSQIISFANTLFYALIDPLNQTQKVINMMSLCGWTTNGIFFAFLQQAAFLMLAMVFIHSLLLIQPYWYGWLTDGIFAAIICVFVPIAPLRSLLVSFFKAIMFNGNAALHIALCLVLSAIFSLISLAVLKRKTL